MLERLLGFMIANPATGHALTAGRDDPSTPPAMAEAICAGIAQAELLVHSRAAHLLAVERADAAGRYLRAFLDRIEAAGA
ncbi:hypothetical protein MKK67_21260 [Methylobacterium sp. J-072]|uniref:alpha/beta fold hydrolase n=1 Tax=Methylobacterium sp. J-072 TaxID=2836651 RepID=UPI001FB8917A|nr:hypothetical protein [Methylobacterium sp. J-072]MCJ2095009.1 hypothetical protein [Methylobacterium sp. J-072]